MENGNKYITPSIGLVLSGAVILFIFFSKDSSKFNLLIIPGAVFILSIISFLMENRKVYRPLNVLIILALILTPIVTLTLAVLSLGAPW